jgi:hypothetical protein
MRGPWNQRATSTTSDAAGIFSMPDVNAILSVSPPVVQKSFSAELHDAIPQNYVSHFC